MIEINGNDLRKMMSMGVYVFMNGEDCLYVGQSHCMIERIGRHNQKKVIEFCDSVKLFECASVDDMNLLEADLIKEMKPVYNKYNTVKHRIKSIMSEFGISYGAARNRLYRSVKR